MQVHRHLTLRIWSRERKRQADRRGSGLRWGKAMEGPWDPKYRKPEQHKNENKPLDVRARACGVGRCTCARGCGRATSMICALCSCAFAVGRHFVTLLVLGLQVQLHQTPAQERRVGDTDVDISVEMAVGPLVTSGCSLRTEGTLLRVRKPDNPHRSAHDETLKHARTTRWCELGWVFTVNRH